MEYEASDIYRNTQI